MDGCPARSGRTRHASHRPRGHQRTPEPQARRLLELAEGGQAGRAVDVQGVEDDAGGQAEVGRRPARPPALELAGVGGGVVDAVADQGMLGRPVTSRAATAGAGQAGPARGGAGPVDRIDGDAAGGVAEGGVQQRVHATWLLSAASVARWWVCQAASSSAWMAAWTARAASRRIIADRGILAAKQSEDPLMVAAGSRLLAHALLAMAATTRPSRSRSPH